jgi:hypothetical protein
MQFAKKSHGKLQGSNIAFLFKTISALHNLNNLNKSKADKYAK